MCGIIGYVGKEGASARITDGLLRLEYRGYDSVGIAIAGPEGIIIRKDKGMVGPVSQTLGFASIPGNAGIGHTRWATHGGVSRRNAHPHEGGDLVLVHNGVIENYMELKSELSSKGRVFDSDTDSEVIAHLIDSYAGKSSLPDAIRKATERLEGSYAIVLMSRRGNGTIYALRRNSPLILGIGNGESFAASDISAMLPYTRSFISLEEGEIAVLDASGVRIEDRDGRQTARQPFRVDWSAEMAQKSGYPHFMRKEIDEQEMSVRQALSSPMDEARGLLSAHQDVHVLACGTSYHSALILCAFLSRIGKNAHAFIASDYPFVSDPGPGTLLIAISQSGETADVLQALRHGGACRKIAVTNTVGSTITSLSDAVIYLNCGPEMGVAATKTFTSQLAVIFKLILPETVASIPDIVARSLLSESDVKEAALRVKDAEHAFFLARAGNVPIAFEGSLKFKEITYIHSEAYPSGELKHGTLSLITEGTPVIVLAPKDAVVSKVLGNLKEAKARGALIISLTNDERVIAESDAVIRIQDLSDERLYPFAMIAPLQLLAYHVSVLRGIDPDRPRNLAKSVTVE